MITVPSQTTLLAEALRENAPAGPAVEEHLRGALDQAVTNPGKLQRACLVEDAARAHGLPEASARLLACAVEYFHLASLLFDDLPCMDNATVRRGRPCVHRVHGEAAAILAGLALIARAHALVGIVYGAAAPAVRMQAALCVDACLGVNGLVGGQAHDLAFTGGPRAAAQVSRIAAAKTGALFRLALVLPALASAPTAEELRDLHALALYWGLWFQAVDDLRDVLSTETETGKTGGRDRALKRPNLALAIGVPATRRRLARLEGQIARRLARLPGVDSRWAHLCQFHETLSLRAAASAA